MKDKILKSYLHKYNNNRRQIQFRTLWLSCYIIQLSPEQWRKVLLTCPILSFTTHSSDSTMKRQTNIKVTLKMVSSFGIIERKPSNSQFLLYLFVILVSRRNCDKLSNYVYFNVLYLVQTCRDIQTLNSWRISKHVAKTECLHVSLKPHCTIDALVDVHISLVNIIYKRT